HPRSVRRKMSIDARSVSISLGGKPIDHAANLVARPGQVTAICGPNGSGKTTLLKAISGDLPYTGEVHMNGRDRAAMKPWEAASIRGVLPQATSLSFPFTVREIVALGLMSGRSGAQASEERRLP